MAKPSSAPVARTRRKTNSVTMQDVARLADCATSTVSLFIRKPELVQEKTGVRIASAIDRLGYVPNMMAGGLAAAGATKVVSMIVPSLRNAFFATTADALQTDLAAAGVQLLLGHTEYDLAQEEALVRASLAWSPTALVLTGLEHSRGTRQMLLARATPVIEMWELGSNPLDIMVGFDHRAAGIAAIQHLFSVGCKKPVFLSARLHQDQRAAQRGAGALSAMKEKGCPLLHFTDREPASVAIGAALMAQALKSDIGIDGVACSNDSIALGALFECQRRNIAVPERVKIIGFGDLSFSPSTNPALSTIKPPGEKIGKEVARLALAGPGHTQASKTVDVGFELIQRQTT